MKELARHIEALLLENDCVILPHFGGFVTNHVPARWVEEEYTFLPPFRTIGFNPQLKINDGLLVQSYMQTYDATYPEATRLVETAIDKLCEELYKEGVAELHGIGTLHRTIIGDYQFDPLENGVVTPTLYGLGAAEVKPLAVLENEKVAAQPTLPEIEQTIAEDTTSQTVIEKKHRTITINIRQEWLTNAVAVAAAVILFFFLSTPVDNTYIEEENYASLGGISVFEHVKKESIITTLVEPLATHKEVKPTTAPKKNLTQATPSTTKADPSENQASKKPAIKEEKTAIVTNKVAKPIQPAEKHAVVNPVPAKVETKPVTPTTQSSKDVATKVTTKQSPVTYYNIIVASVPSESDVNHTIDQLSAKGYPGAYLIKGNGRFRIALKGFPTEVEAYRYVNELKQNDMFKDAWVLKAKR